LVAALCGEPGNKKAMPNQRSKDKTYLGGYVDKDLYAAILNLAKAEGMVHNKFGFVEKLIREALARRVAAR
jgi:hypothetical protein